MDYRKLLQTWKAELITSLQTDIHVRARSNGTTEECISEAMQDQFLAIQMKRLDLFQLQLVERALHRLDAGESGEPADPVEPIANQWRHVISGLPCAARVEDDLGAAIPDLTQNGDRRTREKRTGQENIQTVCQGDEK